jgi:hypothetical protein
MYIGHFAIGFAAKRAAPKTSLGTLFFGVLWSDLLCSLFMLAGFEHAQIGSSGYMPIVVDFPYSHGLAPLIGWAALLGGLYFWKRHDGRGTVVLALCVLSHWLADWVTHRPDMTLYPGGARYGLALWEHPLPAGILEYGMLAVGVYLYGQAARPTDKTGRWALWSLVGFLALTYATTFFTPPPPNAHAMAVFNLTVWLFPFWGYWIDRHTEPVGA